MNPAQTLAERAVDLARLVRLATSDLDPRLTLKRLDEARAKATDILDFDRARRRVVVEGPWKPRPDQPGVA